MPTEAHPTRDEILAYTTGRLDEPIVGTHRGAHCHV